MIRGNRTSSDPAVKVWDYLPIENGDDGSLESDLLTVKNNNMSNITETIECEACEGTGLLYISCCGDDMRGDINETDLCPPCREHCGDEGETCDECDGTGLVVNPAYVASMKQLYDAEVNAGIYDPKNPTQTLEEKQAEARKLK